MIANCILLASVASIIVCISERIALNGAAAAASKLAAVLISDSTLFKRASSSFLFVSLKITGFKAAQAEVRYGTAGDFFKTLKPIKPTRRTATTAATAVIC